MDVTGGGGLAILASGVMGAAVREAAVSSGDMVVESLQNFPFKNSSGKFAQSISAHISDTPAGITVTIDSDLDHAIFLETGTRGGYVINARNGRALVWDGRTIQVSKKSGALGAEGKGVTRQVRKHPGIRNPPRPFKTVADEQAADVEAAIFAAVDSVIAGALASGGQAFTAGGRLIGAGGITSGVFRSGPRVGQAFFRGAGGRFI